jgi:ATP-binding cassette, subfamily C, bacterial LapB
MREPHAHWLWGTLRKFLPYYRSALLAALLSNVLMLVTGLVTSVVFDKVIPHQAFVTLWALAAAGFAAVAFDLLARQLRAHLIDSAGRKTDLLIGAALFRQTLATRLEHRPASSGRLRAHAGADRAGAGVLRLGVAVGAVRPAVHPHLRGDGLHHRRPAGLGAGDRHSRAGLMSAVIQGALRRAMMKHMRQQADLHGVLVESVDGIEDLKAAGAQGRFLRHYEQTTAAGGRVAAAVAPHHGVHQNVSAVAQQLVTLILLVWGVYLIDDKIITGGALVGSVMFAARALAPLSSVVQLATRYQGARAAMRALDHVMAQPVERDERRAYVPRTSLTGRIALVDVGFAYPPQEDAPPRVLKGVTLRFEPGERVAILGRIGSGKSTVLRLLAGLYQPTEGHGGRRRHRPAPDRPGRLPGPRGLRRARTRACSTARCARTCCSTAPPPTRRAWPRPRA